MRGVLGKFFLATLLWLPVCFALWYLASGHLSAPSVWLSEQLLSLFWPELIHGVEGLGRHTHFVTRVAVASPQSDNMGQGLLMVSINPLIYSWNLPVVAALLFAAEDNYFSSWRLLVAYVVLSLLHVWGISFDVLRSLAFSSGPEAAAALGLSGWQREAVALAYQFGYLMLPVIGAATCWLLMSQQFIRAVLLERGNNPGDNSSPD